MAARLELSELGYIQNSEAYKKGGEGKTSEGGNIDFKVLDNIDFRKIDYSMLCVKI